MVLGYRSTSPVQSDVHSDTAFLHRIAVVRRARNRLHSSEAQGESFWQFSMM